MSRRKPGPVQLPAVCGMDSCFQRLDVKDLAGVLQHYLRCHGVSPRAQLSFECPRCGLCVQRYSAGLAAVGGHSLVPFWTHAANVLGGCGQGVCSVTISPRMSDQRA